MAPTDARLLADVLAGVRAGWPGGAWEWDGRFSCALAKVSGGEQASKAREMLTAQLPVIWSADKLAEAPASVRQVCARTGGLRGDQLVFSAELADGALCYCLWWPWGSGREISARIGAAGGPPAVALRVAFGIP